jgi:UDP:flavonoid glycosyltransferase YjiC (YdhE family)
MSSRRPDYREAARRMQASLAAEEGAGHAADEIAATALA